MRGDESDPFKAAVIGNLGSTSLRVARPARSLIAQVQVPLGVDANGIPPIPW
jgi:hypothetical protein